MMHVAKDTDPIIALGRKMSFLPTDLAMIMTWWNSFDEADCILFRILFGGLLTLASITVVDDFLRALRPFWLSHLSLFRFGVAELGPSLEEYHFLMGMGPTLSHPIVTSFSRPAKKTIFPANRV